MRMASFKKLLCLALAVLMVSAVFAEKKKLVFFGLNDFDSPDFFKPFEDANNVTIEKILQPSDKFKEAILVAVNGGQQLDVGLINGQDIRAFSTKGLLSDLSSDVKYMDRFFDSSAR